MLNKVKTSLKNVDSFDFDAFKFKNKNISPNIVQEIIVKIKEKEKIGFFDRFSMRIAKNLIVVGDIRQLPQIDDSSFENRNKILLEEFNVSRAYSYQAKLIQDKFGDKVDASTIHKFQGREKKTIIFSSVLNDVNDFVGNDNLVNVACFTKGFY